MKVSKKILKEKYPKKPNVGESVTKLFLKILTIVSVFTFAALGADVYQLLH